MNFENPRKNTSLGRITGLAMALLPLEATADSVNVYHQESDIHTITESITNPKVWDNFVLEMRNHIEQSLTEVGGLGVIDNHGKFSWSYVGTFSAKGVSGLTYENFKKTDVGSEIDLAQMSTIIQFHTHPPIYNFAPPSELDIGQQIFDAPESVAVSYVAIERNGIWYWNNLSLRAQAESGDFYKKEDLTPAAQTAYVTLFGDNDSFYEPTSRAQEISTVATLIENLTDEEIRQVYLKTQAEQVSDYLKDADNTLLMRDSLFRYARLAYPAIPVQVQIPGSLFSVLLEATATSIDFKIYADSVRERENTNYESLKTELTKWRTGEVTPKDDLESLIETYKKLGVLVEFVPFTKLE